MSEQLETLLHAKKLIDNLRHPCEDHPKRFWRDTNEDGTCILVACIPCNRMIGGMHPEVFKSANPGIKINSLKQVFSK